MKFIFSEVRNGTLYLIRNPYGYDRDTETIIGQYVYVKKDESIICGLRFANTNTKMKIKDIM